MTCHSVLLQRLRRLVSVSALAALPVAGTVSAADATPAPSTPPMLAAVVDAPVSPNALPEVSRLLTFLHDISGDYVLSGQQETVDWEGKRNESEMDFIYSTTGELPALRGFDYMYYTDPVGRPKQKVTERAIEWARRGGVVAITLSWYAGTPRADFNVAGSDFDLDRALSPGTQDNKELLEEMDLIAAELKKLRDAGVPVLWRPFHQASGAQYWWGAKGAESFKKVWKLMYDRFTQQHGLTNLIWVYSPTETGTLMETWYPGDAYVDMGGFDLYPTRGTRPSQAAHFKRMFDFFKGEKVVALTETGAIPEIDKMFQEGANWSYFMLWSGNYLGDGLWHTVEQIRTVYRHPKVLTLREMPNVYQWAPHLTRHPADVTANAGANVTLVAEAAGTGVTYQWLHNDVVIPGATSSTYTVPNTSADKAGKYTVRVTNTYGSTVSNAATLTFKAEPHVSPSAALANISTRAQVGLGNEVMIAGFVVGGTGAKRVLIRAIGPTLGTFGVSNTLANPTLTVYGSSGIVRVNDDWAADPAEAALNAEAFTRAGAFALDPASKDAAVVLTLPAGNYTAVVSGVNYTTGITLVEIYDLETDSAARLTNLSTRARTGRAEGQVIAGITVSGTGSKRLLLRGVGPTLGNLGVSGVLADPMMELKRLSGTATEEIASNNDWGSDATRIPELTGIFTQVGAFPLTNGSRDSVLFQPLEAGRYTAQVHGATNGVGVIIVEVYEVP